MILNLVPVLFHLLFYQYLIFRLLNLSGNFFFTRHIQQKRLTCAQAVGSASIPRALVRLWWDLKALPLFLMKTSSLVNISVHSLTTLQSHVLGQEGWFTASEKLEESEF